MSSTTASNALIDMPFEILDGVFLYATPDVLTVCSAERLLRLYSYFIYHCHPVSVSRYHKDRPAVPQNPVLCLLLVSKQWYCQVREHNLPLPTLHFCSRSCVVDLQRNHPNIEAVQPGANF